MKDCVTVGELEEAFPLPVIYTTLGRICAYETEDMGNGGTPISHQRLDQKPKVPLVAGTLSSVNLGPTKPLWTLIILLPKGAGGSWAIA